MCTFVGVDSWGVSNGVPSVVSAAASGDSVALLGSSSSSSSTGSENGVFVPTANHRHTLSVHLRMLPEAILHSLELLHAVNTLGLLFREYETRKSLPELHTAGSMCHSPQTRTIPVYFSSFGIISSRPWLRFTRLSLRFVTLLLRSCRRGFGLFRNWLRFRGGVGF